jgi:hypothetical protein
MAHKKQEITMNKRSIFTLGILFSISILMANEPTPSRPEQAVIIKQQDVDLNLFQNKEVLKMAVEELSKSVPQKVDEYTTLVDVTSRDSTLVYVCEINTGAKSDEAVRKEDNDRMKRAITRGTCNTSQRFLNSGISLSYLYRSAKTKEKLFQFDVSKKDCPDHFIQD